MPMGFSIKKTPKAGKTPVKSLAEFQKSPPPQAPSGPPRPAPHTLEVDGSDILQKTAESLSRVCIREEPVEFEPYVKRGVGFAEVGKFESACRQFELGIRYMNVGLKEDKTKEEEGEGQKPKAEKAPPVDEADRRRAEIYEMFAQCLLECGQYNRALETSRTAVEIDPEWDIALQTKYRCELQWGNPEAALETALLARNKTKDPELATEINKEIRDIEKILDEKKERAERPEAVQEMEKQDKMLRAIADGRAKDDEEKDLKSKLKKSDRAKAKKKAEDGWGDIPVGDSASKKEEGSKNMEEDEKEPLKPGAAGQKAMDVDETS